MTYEIPREAMLQVGVRKGDNLFTCSRDGSKLSCTTRIFHPRCGKHDFAAVGIMSDDEKNIRICGNAPGLDSECNESGRRPQDWAFAYCRRPNRGLPEYAQVAGVRLLGTSA